MEKLDICQLLTFVNRIVRHVDLRLRLLNVPTMNASRLYIQILVQFLIVVLLVSLFSACGTASTTTEASEPETTSTTIPETIEAYAAATVTATATLTSSASIAATELASSSSGVAAAANAAAAVAARTPIPTEAPSKMDERISEVTDSLGVTSRTFLGLSIGDWINLGISILIVLAGYYLGARLLAGALRWIVRRTGVKADRDFVNEIGPEITWLAFLFSARIAVNRLSFLSDGARTALDDIIFTAGLVTVAIAALNIINYAAKAYQDNLRSKNDEPDADKLDPVILAIERVAQLLVLVLAVSIGLSHFGIGVNTMVAMIVIVGFAISFGAQDVISDAISGFIMLVDQPFRIGDAILLRRPDTWGIVVQIGARTTRILTMDNREVIVPNSRICKSEIVNYNYPDPTLRLQSEIRIAFDADLDKVRDVISVALHGVDGVQTDKPVEVFLLEFGDSAYHLSVRWWIETYTREFAMLDKGNSVIKDSLKKAGFDIPFKAYNLNLKQAEQDISQ